MKKISLCLAAIIMLCAEVSFAQINMPQASPTVKYSTQIGLTDVSLEYSRPSARGRKVFGDLVPYAEVWRTGANASTKINFSTDVMVEGKTLPAGNYALYTIPNKESWTIIFSKNTKLWGSMGYNESDDALRVTVKPTKTSRAYETFEITLSDVTDNSSMLAIKWENTSAKVKITTDVDPVVMAQIKEKLIDNDPQDANLYFQGATYYYNNKKDMNQALEWITKATAKSPQYWMIHLEAKIKLELGDKNGAKEAAMKSKALAQEAKNPDYVALNDKLINSIN
ncbi:DUF2911 domain-containing protein [Penaeicola halotolerans]|uniref:DUF2911 domain-containing protein n=1 Tax=Penaeicola halotolerans TaxID=2793196 RepID=UPI001CF86CF6|nr:DUF2911 domain-containing protein [Penaeicola halotolerans]